MLLYYCYNLKEELLRGRPGFEHLNEPLHILIEAELPVNVVDIRLRQAREIIEELLKPVVPNFSTPLLISIILFTISVSGVWHVSDTMLFAICRMSLRTFTRDNNLENLQCWIQVLEKRVLNWVVVCLHSPQMKW